MVDSGNRTWPELQRLNTALFDPFGSRQCFWRQCSGRLLLFKCFVVCCPSLSVGREELFFCDPALGELRGS
jgi:hypothetical protein